MSDNFYDAKEEAEEYYTRMKKAEKQVEELKCCGNCLKYRVGFDECTGVDVIMDCNDSCDSWEHDGLNFKDRSEE